MIKNISHISQILVAEADFSTDAGASHPSHIYSSNRRKQSIARNPNPMQSKSIGKDSCTGSQWKGLLEWPQCEGCSYTSRSFDGVRSHLLTLGKPKRWRHHRTLAHQPTKYRHGATSNCGVAAIWNTVATALEWPCLLSTLNGPVVVVVLLPRPFTSLRGFSLVTGLSLPCDWTTASPVWGKGC